MKYYMIDFGYDGPIGDCEDIDASKANCDADKKVHVAAKALGFNMLHAYSWPDGSLYKYMMSDLSIQELKAAFDSQLNDSGVSANSITERHADEDPYKAYYKTLKEYFEGHKS